MLLKKLESESIYIIREVVANFKNPMLLYSIGKDSSVLLHLARKAFYPGKIPFPLLHVDTTWKFREMISFRDAVAQELGLNLIIHTNEEGLNNNVNPITYSPSDYTYIMKTVALKEALDKYEVDAAIGGARRDEEKSRAKEKIFSLRGKKHTWDPKNQRPEFWNNYNTLCAKDDTFRVFPLSNWTELDIWRYIQEEHIQVVPLYFSQKRPVMKEGNKIIMVDDKRLPITNEKIEYLNVRFRTLGCYPLTQAIESKASTISAIIQEITEEKHSERQGRLIDHDEDSGLEQKKKEGYF